MAYKKTHNGWKAFGAILLALVLFAGGCALGWFAKQNKWFEKDPSPAEDQDGKNDEVGGLTVEKSAEGSGISLASVNIPAELYEEYSISPAAENAQTITATVFPNNDALNTGVTWSAAWKNPSSAFAKGKDVKDYLTLTPAGEGYRASKTVTAECLQAFGEKIIITCECVENPAAQATVTADYVQKVSVDMREFEVSFTGDSNAETVYCDFKTGITYVPFACKEGAKGMGGKFEYWFNDDKPCTIYATAKVELEYDPFSPDYKLFQTMTFCKKTGNNGSSDLFERFDFSTYDVAANGIIFSLDFFEKNFYLCELSMYSASPGGGLTYYTVRDMTGQGFYGTIGSYLDHDRDPLYYGLFKMNLTVLCEEADMTLLETSTLFVIDGGRSTY